LPSDPFRGASNALERQADRLNAVDEPELAEAYLTARAALGTPHRHEAVTRLRAPLEKVVERLVAEQGTHQ